MQKLIGLVILILLVSCSAEEASDSNHSAHINAVPNTLNLLMNEQMPKLKIPGAAVAYIEDGQVQWASVYGQAAQGRPFTLNCANELKPSERFTKLAMEKRLGRWLST